MKLSGPLFVIWLCLCVFPSDLRAHALQPGYLELRAVAGDTYRVFWRVPNVQGQPMEISPQLPQACAPDTGPPLAFDGGGWSTTWIATCEGGLAGGNFTIKGLELQRTDVLVRLEANTGTSTTVRLTPDNVSFVAPENPDMWYVVRTYLPLGVTHILGGLDHLLFVLALLLLIRDRWRLVGAITAFTIAHSITMAAATFEWVSLPGPPVEAIIALSIMFVASELAQRDDTHLRLSERFPWAVSFSFGLLHGFGFAGALREIGLPPDDVPLALLSFNIGVEIGQLLFVAAILALGLAFRYAAPGVNRVMKPGSAGNLTGAYLIGSLSAFWFIDRISAF